MQGMSFKELHSKASDLGLEIKTRREVFFRPPNNVVEEFPQFQVAMDYSELMEAIESFASDLGERW